MCVALGVVPGAPAVPCVSTAVGASAIANAAVTSVSTIGTAVESCIRATVSGASSTTVVSTLQTTPSTDTLSDLSKCEPMSELVDSQMEKIIDQLGQVSLFLAHSETFYWFYNSLLEKVEQGSKDSSPKFGIRHLNWLQSHIPSNRCGFVRVNGSI